MVVVPAYSMVAGFGEMPSVSRIVAHVKIALTDNLKERKV